MKLYAPIRSVWIVILIRLEKLTCRTDGKFCMITITAEELIT